MQFLPSGVLAIMEQREQLREIVARLCRVAPEALHADFSLAALVTGSITCHLLDSALRKHLGIEPPLLRRIGTYAELEAAVLRLPNSDQNAPPPLAIAEAPASSLASSFHSPSEGSIGCGLDIEKVSSLPLADDYWTHEFYVNTFTTTEIAYCVRQANPLMHFTSRWCAKEALKKCEPRYCREKLTDIQVNHDENGAPRLQSARTQEQLPFVLSMTHTDDTAAAVVLRPPSIPRAPLSLPEEDNRDAARRWPASVQWTALALALFGSLMACLAFWRTLEL